MKAYLHALAALSLGAVFSGVTRTQNARKTLDEIYKDETHCLAGPEMRGEKDNAISCYCRDALTDARYVYETYLLSGKDRNLNGTFLTLERNATEMCGDGYGVFSKTREKAWRWNGPEVTRTYPPDSIIEQIEPDSNGFRTVKYEVRLSYHDPHGRTTKVETFSATDEVVPPDFKTRGCPPAAVCPK